MAMSADVTKPLGDKVQESSNYMMYIGLLAMSAAGLASYKFVKKAKKGAFDQDSDNLFNRI